MAKNSYFKASGTGPFWSLDLSEDFIKLTTMSDSIKTPHTLPIRAMDANVKQYKIHTEAVEMGIQIVHSECTNARSGMKSSYTVSIDYKKNADEMATTVQGCGGYSTD